MISVQCLIIPIFFTVITDNLIWKYVDTYFDKAMHMLYLTIFRVLCAITKCL